MLSADKNKKYGVTLVAALVAFVALSIVLAASIPIMTKTDPLSMGTLIQRKERLEKKIASLEVKIGELNALITNCDCMDTGCGTMMVGGALLRFCSGPTGIDYDSANTRDPVSTDIMYDPACNVASVGDGYWGTSFDACGSNAFAGAKKACAQRGMSVPTIAQLSAICNTNLTTNQIEKLWYWSNESSSAGYARRVAFGNCYVGQTNKYNGYSNYSEVLYGGKTIGDTYTLCVGTP